MAHMLEHLEFPKQTFFLLNAIYRVLKQGTTVRIVVPDVAKWMRGKKIFHLLLLTVVMIYYLIPFDTL